jgi:hypothetical protein
VQPFDNDLDIVGQYKIDIFRNCHGCNFTLAASSAHDPPLDKSVVITARLSGPVIASSDASAIVWSEYNSKYQTLIGLYNLKTHHRRFVIAPNGGDPLSARPDGDGFLVAYQTFGPCALNAEELARLTEDQPYREGPRTWSLCFVHIPAPPAGPDNSR